MHGNTLLSISSSLSSSSFSSLSPPFFQNQFLKPSCRYLHGTTTFTPSLFSQRFPTFGNQNRRKKMIIGRASSRESPYDVLGVPPSATPEEIKRAYRKLALRFHPDVNKEANAKEKFMRIKHAYNTIANSKSQKNRRSDYSNSTSGRDKSMNSEVEEEFYGFGNFLRDVQITIEDFFKDLQAEFQNWEASAGSQGKPKSLWEELADIGEEFVEFLEKELNINESDSSTETSNEFVRGNPSDKSGAEKRADQPQNQASKGSSIEDNIDEIEAALAQLKKELGL